MGKYNITRLCLYSNKILFFKITFYIRFITGAEAIPIFMQSGLSQPVLSAIWDIADDDKDTRLSAKEFCVAFHIIVCVGYVNLFLFLQLYMYIESYYL